MPAFIMLRVKVAELHKLYQNNLDTLGMDIVVNRICLNTELLEYFQNSTVQEKKISYSFSFPNGIAI